MFLGQDLIVSISVGFCAGLRSSAPFVRAASGRESDIFPFRRSAILAERHLRVRPFTRAIRKLASSMLSAASQLLLLMKRRSRVNWVTIESCKAGFSACVGSRKRHLSIPTQCDPRGATFTRPSVHTRHSQTRIFDAFRCFAAPFAHEAALPSWDPAVRFSCKHESACWVPRVNWDNKKDRLFTCLPFLIPSKLNTEILFRIFLHPFPTCQDKPSTD